MWKPTQPVFLPEDQAHVYWAEPSDLDPKTQDRLFDLLCEDERASCEKFYFPEDRRAYLTAHALLRWSLSRYFPRDPRSWTFERQKNGRPTLGGECSFVGLSFNLSHSRNLVACIFSRQDECGVDVEPLRPVREYQDIAARHFAPIELEQLAKAQDQAQQEAFFLALWTLKEATLKATGHALLVPLDSVAFQLKEDGAVKLSAGSSIGLQSHEWSFFLERSLRGHCLAAAVRVPSKKTCRFLVQSTQF